MSLFGEQRGFYSKTAKHMDDGQLLQDFAARRDETAFATLVTRHAALVHSVALRLVNQTQLAEDVTQAVFILLARKAGSLRQGTVLSGWLFQTTRFVAQRALRGERRRQHREQEALAMHAQFEPDTAWEQIGPAVDEALAQLNRADRDALLLRFFEGRTLREVGEKTGATEAAAKKRVSRALDKARTLLTQRGTTLSTAALGAAMAQQANATLPAEIVNRLGSAALNSLPAKSLAVKLAEETVSAWRWAKLKAAAAFSGLAISIGVLSLWSADRGGIPLENPMAGNNAQTPALAASRPAGEPARPATSLSESNTKVLRFRAVNAVTGDGIANARVVYVLLPNRAPWYLLDATANAAGECVISYPSDTGRLDIGVVQPGFEARFATWPSEGFTEIPGEYTLRLRPVTNVIGGHILDAQDRPVANATVRFQANGTGDSSHRERPRERFGFLLDVPVATTDAQGCWSLKTIPPQNPGFSLEARHPNFADTSMVFCEAQHSVQDTDKESLRQLWAGNLVTRMHPAFTLVGRVVDEQANPIAGAKIQERAQSEVFSTDTSGTFHLPKLPAGSRAFTFSAEGYSPERKTVEIAPDMPPITVILRMGAILRVKVVDEYEVGIPEATVILEQWGDHRNASEWRARTGADGRLEWASAPRDVVLELCAVKEGFVYTRDIQLKADGEEHVIRMRHALDVYGRVVEANTGYGIRDFRVVPGYGGYGNRMERWFAVETVRGTNGTFKLTFSEPRQPWQVRILAEGYEDWISEPLTNESTVTLDIALKRATLETAWHGVVFKPDGTPAAGAHVAQLSFEHSVFINSGLGIPSHHQTPLVVKPGETTPMVMVDQPGTRITGQFLSAAERPIAWQKDLLAVQCHAEPAISPLAVVPAGLRPLAELEFWTSPAGREYVNTPRLYSILVRNDGSFVSLEALRPGRYRFTAAFQNSSITHFFEIPDSQLSELPLGQIQLQ